MLTATTNASPLGVCALSRHYACYELPTFFPGPLTPREQLLRVLVLVAMALTGCFVAVFGFGGLFTLSIAVAAAQGIERRVRQFNEGHRHLVQQQNRVPARWLRRARW